MKFRSCSILRSACLGTGAYGAVYKAHYDNLLCAAKVLHPDLELVFNTEVPPETLHRLPRMRFESECQFLRAIHHPNVIQYLGTTTDPVTNMPVLLMELMDTNLTGYLGDADQPLPFHTQVNICHDVALALSFLHSNDIIHRDLSSNNVLMIGDRRAKVADFGMARVFTRADSKLTSHPGTEVYMPPEALSNTPTYEASMDCFSFGVLAIQVLTLVYPKPSIKFIPVQDGGKDLHRRVSEVERRQNHIELVEADHPILRSALQCLEDKEKERPTAQQLCHTLEQMQESERFSESKRANDLSRETKELKETLRRMREEHKHEISSLKTSHSEAIEQLEREREEEMAKLKQLHIVKTKELQESHLCEVRDLRQVIKAQEEEKKFIQHNHNHDIMRIKESHTLHIKSIQEEREELRQRLKCVVYDMQEKDSALKRLQRARDSPEDRSASENGTRRQSLGEVASPKASKLVLNWTVHDTPAPQALCREDSGGVYCNETLYMRPGSHRLVLAYNPGLDSWREMPKCPYKHSTLAHIRNTLLAVGGRTDHLTYLNKIHYLTDEGGQCRWEEAEFQMPTKRCSVVTLTAGSSLVVAGGDGEEARLRKVEVMNTDTYTWSVAVNLPEALLCSSATFRDGQIYLLGGEFGYNGVEKNIFLTCLLEDLLKTSTKYPQRPKIPVANVWKVLQGPRVTRSTCVSFQGAILSLGGRGEDKRPTTAVYRYAGGVWDLVGYMSVTRTKCFAAVLPDDEILVVGGHTSAGRTDSLEVGTVWPSGGK